MESGVEGRGADTVEHDVDCVRADRRLDPPISSGADSERWWEFSCRRSAAPEGVAFSSAAHSAFDAAHSEFDTAHSEFDAAHSEFDAAHSELAAAHSSRRSWVSFG